MSNHWTPKQSGLFALIALAALWPLFFVGLNCDDFTYLAFARGIAPLMETWRHVPGALTRPLSTWTFVGLLHTLDKPLPTLGLLRLAHHVFNAVVVGYIARHALGVVPAAARLAALTFLVWGSHGELFYFSGIHDLSAATFTLGALAISCRKKPMPYDGVAVAVMCLAAYACKESSWGLPLMLLALPRQERAGKPGRDSAIAAGTLGLILVTRMLSVHSLRGDLEPGIYSRFQWGTIARSSAKLWARSFVPGWVDMQVFADLGKQHRVMAAIIGLFIAGVVAFIARQARLPQASRSLLAKIAVCFLAALAPACQLSVSMENLENARYLYLSTVFVALGFAVLVDGWSQVTMGTTRIAGLGFAAALLGFQAASLNLAGMRWMEASRLTERYVAALNAMLTSNPSAEHVYVVCAPDNYRGAFAARNVSAEVGRMHRSPRAVDVLATRYLFGHNSSELCRWSEHDGQIVVHGDTEKRSLTHPGFYYGETEIQVGPWQISPVDLANQRSRDLLIKKDSGTSNDLLAVYDGSTFNLVSLN